MLWGLEALGVFELGNDWWEREHWSPTRPLRLELMPQTHSGRFLPCLSCFIHTAVSSFILISLQSFQGLFHLHLRRIPFFPSKFSDLKLLMLHNTADNPSLCSHLMSSFPRINTAAPRVWDKQVFSEPPSRWKPESGYFNVVLSLILSLSTLSLTLFPAPSLSYSHTHTHKS